MLKDFKFSGIGLIRKIVQKCGSGLVKEWVLGLMLPENIRKSVSNNESLTLNIISTSMFPSFFIVAGVWVMYGISIFVMNGILRKRKLKLISLKKKTRIQLFVRDRDGILHGVAPHDVHGHRHDADVNENSCARIQHSYSKSKHLNKPKPRQ